MKSFIRLTQRTILNYSNTTKNILFIDVSVIDQPRMRQSWQTYKGGNVDQEDQEHELRRGELPTEPHMGQAFTY